MPAGHPSDQLHDRQVDLLVGEMSARRDRIVEVVDLLTRLAEAGGREWVDYERVLEGVAREAMQMVLFARSARNPEMPTEAAAALAAAAHPSSQPLDGTRQAVHHKVAMSLLACVWCAGEHHLIEPDEWPPELAAVVLGAVRTAARVNDHPMMRSAPRRDRRASP